MFTVKRTEDTEEIRSFLGARAPKTEPCIFMATHDAGELVAVAWLALKGYRAYLDGLVCKPDRPEMETVTAKATLNYADVHGIETVYGDNPALDGLYRALGFQDGDDVWKLSLAGYFDARHEDAR